MLPIEQKLEICKSTRQIAARTLHTVLGELLHSGQPISESRLRDKWLEELRKNPSIFPDGWYLPPPHGIGVLIGTTNQDSRQNYKSLRPEEMWPREDIVLNKEHPIMYAFASPVDRKTGIIGDFGMTLYFGDDPEIIHHLKICLQLDQEIYEKMQVGMSFSKVSQIAEEQLELHGLINKVTSITDPAGVNIGHTLPASYEDWSSEEFAIIQKGEARWEEVAQLISKKRRFLSKMEKLQIKPGMALTNESRPTVENKPHIPMASFHTIVVFHSDGKKELLTNFDEIFRLTGMDYMFTSS